MLGNNYYFEFVCSSSSEKESVVEDSLDDSLSDEESSLELDEESSLESEEVEYDSASEGTGAIDSAFSASETFFFKDSGTGIIPSFTIYWKHWRMQLFSLKTSSLNSCVRREGVSGYASEYSIVPTSTMLCFNHTSRSLGLWSFLQFIPYSLSQPPVRTRAQYPRTKALQRFLFFRQGSCSSLHLVPYLHVPCR